MATYYVRKTGSDSNDGLSAVNAFLTIDKAANTVAAGDTVYVGSGVYREMVTMDTAGTSGSEISFIGDIDGLQTGDAGPVIISAFATDTGGAARNYCVDMNEKEFIIWQYFIFDGGDTACIGGDAPVSPLAYEGFQFLDCAMLAGDDTSDRAARILFDEGVVPTGDGLQIKRCFFSGQVILYGEGNAVGNINIKATIENCVVDGGIPSAGYDSGVYVYSTSGTYSFGGIDIKNCIIQGFENAVEGVYLKDTTNQVRTLNCRINSCLYGVVMSLSTANSMYEDYNFCSRVSAVKVGNVQQGGNSSANCAGMMVGGMADLMFWNKLGWSPWKPWEPMSLIGGSWAELSVEAGSASYAPADDLYGVDRPMGRTPADDVGPVEARIRPQKETTTTYGGSDTSLKLAGTGYAQLRVPVDAAETTVTVYGRYNSSYSGSNPKMEVINITGDSDQDDTMTGAADTWEQLSCTFTPTEAGHVTVRLWSQDGSGSGEAFFDLLEVA